MADEKPSKVELRFEDAPDLAETFADSVGHWHFDGSTLRIDFLVTRFDEPKAPNVRSGRKTPVSRLVLTAPATVDLLNQCRRITAAMEKVGLVSGKDDQSSKQPN